MRLLLTAVREVLCLALVVSARRDRLGRRSSFQAAIGKIAWSVSLSSTLCRCGAILAGCESSHGFPVSCSETARPNIPKHGHGRAYLVWNAGFLSMAEDPNKNENWDRPHPPAEC